jgi:hypothetical protein
MAIVNLKEGPREGNKVKGFASTESELLRERTTSRAGIHLWHRHVSQISGVKCDADRWVINLLASFALIDISSPISC